MRFYIRSSITVAYTSPVVGSAIPADAGIHLLGAKPRDARITFPSPGSGSLNMARANWPNTAFFAPTWGTSPLGISLISSKTSSFLPLDVKSIKVTFGARAISSAGQYRCHNYVSPPLQPVINPATTQTVGIDDFKDSLNNFDLYDFDILYAGGNVTRNENELTLNGIGQESALAAKTLASHPNYEVCYSYSALPDPTAAGQTVYGVWPIIKPKLTQAPFPSSSAQFLSAFGLAAVYNFAATLGQTFAISVTVEIDIPDNLITQVTNAANDLFICVPARAQASAWAMRTTDPAYAGRMVPDAGSASSRLITFPASIVNSRRSMTTGTVATNAQAILVNNAVAVTTSGNYRCDVSTSPLSSQFLL